MGKLAGRRMWAAAATALGDDPGDRAVRAAILAQLRATRLSGPVVDGAGTASWLRLRSLRDHSLAGTLSLMLDGRPYPSPGEDDGAIGLVRALDLRAGRHGYAAGRVPPGQLAGELGALHAEPVADSVPLWSTSDGWVLTG